MPAEVIDLVSSPDPEAKVIHKPKPTVDQPTKNTTFEPSWGWNRLSSSEAETLPLPKPATSKPATVLTNSTANRTTKPLMSFAKDAHEFIDLLDSDDDASKSDLPPPKRRRVSSSPQARPAKTTVPKAGGFKRSVSNIESSTKVAGSSKSAAASNPKITKTNTQFEDEIVFTSSPDYLAEAARKRKEKRRQSRESDDDSNDNDDHDLPALNAIRNYNDKSKSGRSKTTNTYPIDEDSEDGSGLAHRKKKDNVASKFRLEGFDDLELSSEPEASESEPVPSRNVKNPSKKSKVSSQSALDKYNAEKAKEKAGKDKKDKAAEKAAAKEAEREKKKLEREEKARQKEKDAEIAKANQRRTDKKVSIKEMIVDMPSCINAKLKDQVRTYLESKEATYNEVESTLPVMKWRRNIDREYNEEKAMWDAVPKRIISEDHVMCILLAKELVDLVTGEEGQDLDAHVLRLKAKFDSCKIIYLIEGYNSWFRKNRLAKERQFQAAVRPQEPPTASQRRKKKDDEYVHEDLIEDAMLKLHVVHGTLIHHTEAWNATAEWVLNFTEQISLKPDKLKNQTLDTTFCMESGQVKTGEDSTDIYVKMLQSMKRITQPIAWGIVSEFPTVQLLVKGLEENGPLALAECRKAANGNGSFQDGKIGPSISRRVHKVFQERDASSTEV
ncbi:uncharacterized protein LY89DRAFT_727761 [Mollisia scopiformis]|uniref:ERCC4 domain-containing protein n=1 Tax=Mollisia scopiformis TaxID=149040 RepID=A0A194XS50_MOLSC|nr:uncharacterized protein LY89DRAFT_727761 [Mollisia scopiformis]KUJ22971.1 hypothetical protein LY89DRAFT_727761 [Mollisia scopiformis]